MMCASEFIQNGLEAVKSRAVERDTADGERSVARAAKAFAAFAGRPVSMTELDGLMFQLCIKIARAMTPGGRHNPDNYTDMVGYAGLAGECAERMEEARRIREPRPIDPEAFAAALARQHDED